MSYSVIIDSKFLLEWCQCFVKPQGWYIHKPYYTQLICMDGIRLKPSYTKAYIDYCLHFQYSCEPQLLNHENDIVASYILHSMLLATSLYISI